MLIQPGSLSDSQLGEALSSDVLSGDEYDRLRIMRGVPLMGKELSLDVNPLEAGLKRCISFTKGCYIGQEVIARLDSYNKLQRTIAAFEILSQSPVLPGIIEADGEEVGWTTSHCMDSAGARQYALGYLRIDSAQRSLFLRSNRGHQLCGVVKRSLAE
jgi:folate-binding protein YgfZ